ncbi:MAG TPA: Holliday junction resolvase RuvX [Limnobacter sp.]|uniref:Putative pre-16S rRNA nuclease n=2 Tax=Burkholderiaceae TaxID=119060 RepID=A0ABQ5YQ26_9BURK|nr:Holliday junction resolvase RuvX [Limnobacter sp.]GLR24964.1 putative pre-16S rRNA nuclease [Limnobacter litoralis]HEX5487430.1 Holliday junction resolvase RuvX [Limnobacter sp.]
MPSMKHMPNPTLFLAFDFGLKRVGVAFGNSLTKTARGVAVVEADDDAARFSKIEALIREWQPEALVVGVPRNVDGTPNDLTPRCERFARQLQGRFELPCSTVDERYTSAVVESCMGGKAARDSKGKVDMGSACLILEQFFLEGR